MEGESTATNIDYTYFSSPLLSDSTCLTVSDTLCYIELGKSDEILNNIEVYERRQIGPREWQFRYEIDSILVKKAIPCK